MGNDISLSGDKGCGKSTVAEQIVAEGLYVRLSFALPLKNFLRDILEDTNLPEEVLEALFGDKDNTYVDFVPSSNEVSYALMEMSGTLNVKDVTEKFMDWAYKFNKGELINAPVSGRRLLQVVGTEFFRDQISQSFWADLMQESIDSAREDGMSVVVDDTRFPDELELLSKLGFTLVKILPACYETKDVNQGHASENSLKDQDFDMYFLNDKALGKEPIHKFVQGII